MTNSDAAPLAPLAALAALAGRWTGSNRLRLSWPTPSDFESAATAEVTPVADGRFVTVAYTWAHDGKPCAGFLLVGRETTGDVVHASWVDSWHQRERPMPCTGTADGRGGVDVRGSYAAPPGPDWGWRIALGPTDDGGLRLTMWNVTPAGEEDLAVEAVYRRAER